MTAWAVHPGADPGRIRLEIDGPEAPEIDDAGNLLLALAGGEVAHRTPRIFQEIDGARREVPGAFVRRGEREIGFEVAFWDRERPLVIDPSVEYATYLGGTNNEQLASIALDADRNVYVASLTPASPSRSATASSTSAARPSPTTCRPRTRSRAAAGRSSRGPSRSARTRSSPASRGSCRGCRRGCSSRASLAAPGSTTATAP